MQSASMTHRLLVVGGTGLLGTQIVRQASALNWHVTSLSRTPGHPPVANVHYVHGDASSKYTVQSVIGDHKINVIVHAVGILFPNPNLNKLVNSKSVAEALSNIPLAFLHPDHVIAYQPVHFDMLTSLFESAAPGSTVVYISAHVSPLMKAAVNSEYLRTKNLAESFLMDHQDENGKRTVVVRPGIVASLDRPLTFPLALVAKYLLYPLKLVPKVLTPEEIARGVIRAIEDRTVQGTLLPDQI